MRTENAPLEVARTAVQTRDLRLQNSGRHGWQASMSLAALYKIAPANVPLPEHSLRLDFQLAHLRAQALDDWPEREQWLHAVVLHR
jgi:hypothetical protein